MCYLSYNVLVLHYFIAHIFHRFKDIVGILVQPAMVGLWDLHSKLEVKPAATCHSTTISNFSGNSIPFEPVDVKYSPIIREMNMRIWR